MRWRRVIMLVRFSRAVAFLRVRLASLACYNASWCVCGVSVRSGALCVLVCLWRFCAPPGVMLVRVCDFRGFARPPGKSRQVATFLTGGIALFLCYLEAVCES